MKKVYILSLSLIIGICFSNKTIGQSLSAPGTVFLPQDSIEFTFSDPAFTSTDWIGIYKADRLPGDGGESIAWDYVKSSEGRLKLKAPQGAGNYKAFLCCCDGYDVVATSAEFSVAIPSLTTLFPYAVEGDSIMFTYISPRFSPTDKIAIYSEGTVPGPDTQPVSWKYITSSSGELTFATDFGRNIYNAYLLCCDGYDVISDCSFEVLNATEPILIPKEEEFAAGTSLEFFYNDPDFAAGDWIGLYYYGEPTTGSPITWSQIVSKAGIVSFPGVLPEQIYVAVLGAGAGEQYFTSDYFYVTENTSDSYIKTAAGVYQEGNTILVNYKDANFLETDWIGIYKKGNIPGGPDADLWAYAPSDSSTIEFGYLPKGDYIVYLLCCDGYDIKEQYEFKVVGTNTASLVFSSIAYGLGDPLVFNYNDPGFASGGGTDWIGIYRKGDIPADVRSIIWVYLPNANGEMTFSVPYPNGTLPEDNPGVVLEPGEYYAGLFCCDAYGLYAQASFIVREFPTSTKPDFIAESSLSLFPNPTDGVVNIKMSGADKLQRITAYNITGQVVYQEKLDGTVNQKALDLKFLNKGVYFIEALTEKYKVSKRLIIQ